MSSFEVLTLLVMLFTKHLFIDFPIQTAYQYLNKGTYGHPGGILHSALHAVATLLIVLLFNPLFALALAVFDFAVHYHIDWAKVQLNNRYRWKPDTHSEFWTLLGVDQYLHALTYFAIVYILLQV